MKTLNRNFVVGFALIVMAFFTAFTIQKPPKLEEKLFLGTWKEAKDTYIVYSNGKLAEQREYLPDSRNKYTFKPGGQLEVSMFDEASVKIVKAATTWKIDAKNGTITCGAYRISPILQEAETVYQVRELTSSKLTIASIREYELAIDTQHASAGSFEYKESEHANKRNIRKTGVTMKVEEISSYTKVVKQQTGH